MCKRWYIQVFCFFCTYIYIKKLVRCWISWWLFGQIARVFSCLTLTSTFHTLTITPAPPQLIYESFARYLVEHRGYDKDLLNLTPATWDFWWVVIIIIIPPSAVMLSARRTLLGSYYSFITEPRPEMSSPTSLGCPVLRGWWWTWRKGTSWSWPKMAPCYGRMIGPALKNPKTHSTAAVSTLPLLSPVCSEQRMVPMSSAQKRSSNTTAPKGSGSTLTASIPPSPDLVGCFFLMMFFQFCIYLFIYFLSVFVLCWPPLFWSRQQNTTSMTTTLTCRGRYCVEELLTC